MGGSSQTTNSQTASNSAQNSATNQSSQMNYGTNQGSQTAQSTGQNSTQTYDPSALGKSYLDAGTTPAINNISSYYNPYQQQVIDATMKQLGQQSGQQQAGIVGNAISNNALGGDRQAVAQQIGATQFENQVAAPTLANLESQGFNTALAGANTANAQNLQAAGMAGGTTAGSTLGSTLGQSLSSTLGTMDSAQAASSAAAGANAGSGSSTTTTNPGIAGDIGMGLMGLSAISGFMPKTSMADGGGVRRDAGGGVGDGSVSELMMLLRALPQIQAASLPAQQQPQQPSGQQTKPAASSASPQNWTQMQQLGQKAGQSLGKLFGGANDAVGNAVSGSAPITSDGGWSTNTQPTGGALGSLGSGLGDLGSSIGSGVGDLGSSIGSAFSGIFARDGGEISRAAGGGATVSAPNVSMPSLSGPSVSAPNVAVPQFYTPGTTTTSKGSGLFGKPVTTTTPESGVGGVYAPLPTVPLPSVPMPSTSSSGGKGSGGAVRGFAEGGDVDAVPFMPEAPALAPEGPSLLDQFSAWRDPDQNGGLSLGDRLANSADRLAGAPETYKPEPSSTNLSDMLTPDAGKLPLLHRKDWSPENSLDLDPKSGLSALTSSDADIGGLPSGALLSKAPDGKASGLSPLMQDAADRSTVVQKSPELGDVAPLAAVGVESEQPKPAGAVNISGPLESGNRDPAKGVGNISLDTNNSQSYGNLGLNSQRGASMWQFQKDRKSVV